MKGRTLKKHAVESLKSLKRNGWMTIAAVSAVTVTLLLVGVFLAVILNFNKLASDAENDVRVRVFVERNTSKKEQKKLREKLENISEVSKVTFSSRQAELDNVVKSYGKEFELFKGDSNPLYDVFVVSAKNPRDTDKVAKKAEKLANVNNAQTGGKKMKNLFNVVDSVKKWGAVASGLLLFVAVFLISNTIRITILSRRTEIEIMRLVGAKNDYIRWPFMLEGAWIGLLGAILPMIFVSVAYIAAYQFLEPKLASSYFSLLTPQKFLLQINSLLIVVGVVIGSLGSGISMRRFLKI